MKHKQILIISFVIALIVVSYTILWPLFKDANYGKVIDYGIVGKVVDEQTGEGLAGVYVILTYRYDYGHSSGICKYSDIAITDADGKYSFKKPEVEMREYLYYREFYFYKDKYLNRSSKYLLEYEGRQKVPDFNLLKVTNSENYLKGLYKSLRLRINFCMPLKNVRSKYLSLYEEILNDIGIYDGNKYKAEVIEDIMWIKRAIENHGEQIK